MMTARSDRTCPPPHTPPPSCCVFAKILPARLSFRYERLFVYISSVLHRILQFFHKLPIMSDVAHLKSLLGVHPDFPKKVRRFIYFFPLLRLLLTLPLSTENRASLSSTFSPSFATLSLLRVSLLISCPTSSTHTK